MVGLTVENCATLVSSQKVVENQRELTPLQRSFQQERFPCRVVGNEVVVIEVRGWLRLRRFSR